MFIKRSIQTSIANFDGLIATLAAQHQDARIFLSLPGAGAALAPRLLAFFGSDRSRYRDAASLQKHSGVAPLTKQSGKTRFVHRRYACNKFWRQTFVEKRRRLVGALDGVKRSPQGEAP